MSEFERELLDLMGAPDVLEMLRASPADATDGRKRYYAQMTLDLYEGNAVVLQYVLLEQRAKWAS